MIKLNNLTHIYGKSSPFANVIFDNTTLEINADKVLVLGKSGSGKSTFFKMLIKMVKVNKKQVVAPSDVLMVMQNVNSQIITDTVYEEINLGYKKKYGKDIESEKVQELFKAFAVSFKFSDDPNRLSGGQKKILMIICMIILNPQLLILDEPLVGLDYKHRKIVLNFIKNTKIKLLISTHQIENLIEICDEIVIIDQKKIIIGDQKMAIELGIIDPEGTSNEL